MEFFFITEFAIPLSQIFLLLGLSTIVLLFGKIKLALLINYLFTLYWGYFLNSELLLSVGSQSEIFSFVYFGFGIAIVLLGVIGFITQQG